MYDKYVFTYSYDFVEIFFPYIMIESILLDSLPSPSWGERIKNLYHICTHCILLDGIAWINHFFESSLSWSNHWNSETYRFACNQSESFEKEGRDDQCIKRLHRSTYFVLVLESHIMYSSILCCKGCNVSSEWPFPKYIKMRCLVFRML